MPDDHIEIRVPIVAAQAPIFAKGALQCGRTIHLFLQGKAAQGLEGQHHPLLEAAICQNSSSEMGWT